jgi:hypothetical protein
LHYFDWGPSPGCPFAEERRPIRPFCVWGFSEICSIGIS